MKKNMMMRLASFLLVAVLISTSAISGTYAKYVTTDSAEDSARVAKFGVVVTADGALFNETYIDAPADTGELRVVSSGSAGDNVVAPGTNSDPNQTLKFSITGQPEVDVAITVAVEDDTEDIFLKAKNDLPKMTTGDTTDKFNLADDYYPVKYTLTQTNTSTKIVDKGTLADLSTALEAITIAKVDANTNLSTEYGEYVISWEWAFDGNDDADTLLGDLAAGTTLTPATTLTNGTDYNLETGLKITVTVTQIN